MLITKEVMVKGNINNLKKLRLLKPDIKINEEILIDIKNLSMGSHILITVECDNCHDTKEIKYYDYNKITHNQTTSYFCKKCKSLSIKKTVNEKYGVDNVFQLENIKAKIVQTNIEKHGVAHHMKNKDIVKKQCKTNTEKYGFPYLMQNQDIIEKQQNTNLEKYGEKYSFLNSDVKEKIIKTNNVLYGVDNPMQNDEIKIKAQNSKNKHILEKYKEYNIISIDKDSYKIKCDKGHDFVILSDLFRNRVKQKTIICTECNKINSYSDSGYQTQLLEFITNNYSGTIIKNDRSTIKNITKPYKFLELDIYLPDINLAFEFNGVYSHNELYRSDKYHMLKSDLCDDLNIQLIHIWEDDWLYKNDIVKSIILNKLNRNNHKIYARKCEIKEVNDNTLARNFLDENHIQGFVGSAIKIGLFYENELVSLMTFGKKRINMGANYKKGEYEFLRYCNKLNTNIIGGSSKLFKYFKDTFSFDEIITYADRSYFNGEIYNKLGFQFECKTEPNYYYVVDGIRKYRYGYRKDILVSEGFDINKSEHDIMLERKIYRIYNAGNFKYIYKNN